jgi:hypothetical protein
MCPSIGYNLFLPAAFTFFHLAFAKAEILALAAALILRLAFLTGFVTDFRPLTFAHLAFCAAAILALPAALIFPRLLGADFVATPSGRKSVIN